MKAGRRWLIHSQWTLFSVLALLAALHLAWVLLAKVDFLYPLWYEVLELDETIATFGPQNRHRTGFELTSKNERVRLFSAIVDAIHAQGRGLQDLVYHDPAGRPLATLLTAPEIQHLQDVARLLSLLNPVGWGALLGWLLLIVLTRLQKLRMPSVLRLMLSVLLFLAATAALVLLLGPVRVFYQLHVWVFPADHQWFFYYQDSLLTTMMRAPDLFAYIALALLGLTVLLLSGMLFLARYVYIRVSP